MRNVLKKVCFLGFLLLNSSIFLSLAFSTMESSNRIQSVQAASLDNAYDFYSVYGMRAIFVPSSDTDGDICFGDCGKKSSASIRFRTIGWKASIYASNGSLLQEIYFQSGGGYLKNEDSREQNGYEYNLYKMKLITFRQRLNSNSRLALSNGSAQIVFDACNVILKNNNPQGGMTDEGPAWGTVYTSYDGIANAQNWTSTTKQLFHEYYGKSVEGLFHTISLQKGKGIKSVSGGGSYCYGLQATLSAVADTGYGFSFWSGSSYSSSRIYTVNVTGDYSLTAYAKVAELEITYYRNRDQADTNTQKVSYQYDKSGNVYLVDNWKVAGYGLTGWARKRNATRVMYKPGQEMKASFIDANQPATSLYGLWEEYQYQIVFDKNAQEAKGTMARQNLKYSQSLTLPASSYTRAGYKFVGWSLNPATKSPDLLVGKQVSLADLAAGASLQYTNNATITLYAVWDGPPAIEAYDLYFTLQEAKEGKITEETLIGYGYAYDQEDGALTYAGNGSNEFCIIGFDAIGIRNLAEGQAFPLTWYARDHVGNETKKKVHLYVVDSTIQEGVDGVGVFRFISKEYFEDSNAQLVASVDGGVCTNSIWRTDENYRKLLREALDECQSLCYHQKHE